MRRILLLGSLALAACAGAERAPGYPELDGLPATISNESFRRAYSHLDDATFREKWSAARKSPLLFFRSFVNTYYADLRQLDYAGPEGFCLGDPHPENFGFLLFSDGSRYVFDDLDDSGECPLLFDALRYFTAVHVMGAGEALLGDLVDEYVGVLRGSAAPRSLPAHLRADLGQKRRKNLKKYVKNGKLAEFPELRVPSPKWQSAVVRALRDSGKGELLDLRAVERKGGGSGGLLRFSLLVRDKSSGRRELLELKELSKAGATFSGVSRPEWGEAERVKTAGERIWRALPLHFSTLKAGGKEFLLRSRTADSIELGDLSERELAEVLRVQAGFVAAYHRGQGLAPREGLKRWILDGAALLSERYRRAMQ